MQLHAPLAMGKKILLLLAALNVISLILYLMFGEIEMVVSKSYADHTVSEAESLEALQQAWYSSEYGTVHNGTVMEQTFWEVIEDTAPKGSCRRKDLELDTRPSEENYGLFQRAANDTYVYEAYFDPRKLEVTYVRIIAVSPLDAIVYCHMWFPHSDKVLLVQAEIYVRQYPKDYPYKSVLVQCPINKTTHDDNRPPTWVVLSDRPCGPPNAVLPVVNNRHKPLEFNFTVCLHKALYNNYGNPQQFVEWIETNRIFGAQKFIFYYYNHSASLQPYLQYYIRQGILEYRSWPLHHVDKMISIYKAQVSVINDCIYRYQYRTRYLALMDPDELLVPKQHEDWMELINNSPCQTEPGIMFRNQIFQLNLPMDKQYTKNHTISQIKVESLAHTTRTNFTWPCIIRSKLIVRPHLVIDGDTHVTRLGEDCCLPETLGALHHYRHWTDTVQKSWKEDLGIFGINKRLKYYSEFENLVTDRRMWHYADKIFRRVTYVFNKVNHTRFIM